MQAVLCEAFGQPEDLIFADAPSPPPAEGWVKIRVRACGVNFPDILLIQGLYQVKPPFPFSPGLEVAGDIIEVGAEGDESRLGERVLATLMWGGMAQEAVAPTAVTRPLPANMSYEDGAAFPLAYGTAHLALTHRAQLRAGETLLVLGAAGGVGSAAVELGALLGARVIAAASTEEKLAFARERGADATINYSSENMRDRLKELTDGRGVDVVFDPVGGDSFDQAVRRIAWEGRYLVIGFASGRIPALPVNIALLKNASLIGVYWGAYWQHDSALIQQSFQQLLDWFSAGALKPHIHRTYPLEEAPAALRALMDRRVLGKVLLTV